jgi:hypothetical protein
MDRADTPSLVCSPSAPSQTNSAAIAGALVDKPKAQTAKAANSE